MQHDTKQTTNIHCSLHTAWQHTFIFAFFMFAKRWKRNQNTKLPSRLSLISVLLKLNQSGYSWFVYVWRQNFLAPAPWKKRANMWNVKNKQSQKKNKKMFCMLLAAGGGANGMEVQIVWLSTYTYSLWYYKRLFYIHGSWPFL